MLNKNNLFVNFTKQQKSSLFHSIKSFVKKNLEHSNILETFLEQENYYLKIGASRLSFIEEYLEDSTFLKELRLYFEECLRYYNYQKEMSPYKEAQKEYLKKQRRIAKDFKMSKEPPTKKQLAYYKSLCKKYNLECNNTESLSKLDLKNMIKEIKELKDENKRN